MIGRKMIQRAGGRFFLLIFFLAASVACAGQPLNRQQAWERVKKNLFAAGEIKAAVYVSRTPLAGGSEIRSWIRTFKVPQEMAGAWFFFIDDAPQANWEHPCRYVFVDTATGVLKVINAATPVADPGKMDKIFPVDK